MFDNVNLYKPDRIIRGTELKEAGDIYGIMSGMGAKDYAYSIAYLPDDELRVIFLKHGQSSPAAIRTNPKIFGERLARQMAHLDGWKKRAISANGSDLAMGIKNLISEGKLPSRAIHKDNIIIGIWSVHPNFRICKVEATVKDQVAWLEGQLTKLHKDDFKGSRPFLNKQDPANSDIMSRTWIDKIVDPNVFEFD